MGSDPSPLIEKFKKLVDPNSEIHAKCSQRKQRKEKNMSATERHTETKKATAATSETIAELFHEAVRSYEKALKSAFNCRRNQ